jgi:hypothetical protein
VALLASACDFLEEQFNETVREVKEEKGLDLNSPAQVAGASLFASEEEGEQLKAARTVQRIFNEQRGDNEMENGDPAKARKHYETALNWTNRNDKRNRDAINEKVADTYLEQTGRGGPTTLDDPALRRGIQNAETTYANLAGEAKDPVRLSNLLYKKAVAQLNGRSSADHCVTLGQALRANPNNDRAKYLSRRDCGTP